ncbi:MAG: phytanoyl-CoA dioxygenase family protein [Planctomycetota bacterium]|nr:phytanoyl-CoA dioxygenase family protein [Planctomycetota bacterium]
MFVTTESDSLFRLSGPSQADIDSFQDYGHIVFQDVLTEDARENLIDEVTQLEGARQFIEGLEHQSEPRSYFVRPWNDRGPYSDRLIDDPFITALLCSTIGDDYHFCHSAYNIAPPGIGELPYHQDHHHWKHENPVNLAERDKYYVQILYYPNGFQLGDRSLKVIPGSHRVAPTGEATPERMLAGEFDGEAECKLKEKRLSLPPGSMVYINARMFHAAEAKPLDSPQRYRIFTIDIFKEAGPPHRFTQEIPEEWLAGASPERKKLFMRDPYTEGCWNAQ